VHQNDRLITVTLRFAHLSLHRRDVGAFVQLQIKLLIRPASPARASRVLARQSSRLRAHQPSIRVSLRARARRV
jgi:hypothetical protein